MMEMKFDEIVSRLQFIVNQLEDNKLPVEEAIKLFEEGMTLIKQGKNKLSVFDKQIKELINNDELE